MISSASVEPTGCRTWKYRSESVSGQPGAPLSGSGTQIPSPARAELARLVGGDHHHAVVEVGGCSEVGSEVRDLVLNNRHLLAHAAGVVDDPDDVDGQPDRVGHKRDLFALFVDAQLARRVDRVGRHVNSDVDGHIGRNGIGLDNLGRNIHCDVGRAVARYIAQLGARVAWRRGVNPSAGVARVRSPTFVGGCSTVDRYFADRRTGTEQQRGCGEKKLPRAEAGSVRYCHDIHSARRENRALECHVVQLRSRVWRAYGSRSNSPSGVAVPLSNSSTR
jgi:hypothetical protein